MEAAAGSGCFLLQVLLPVSCCCCLWVLLVPPGACFCPLQPNSKFLVFGWQKQHSTWRPHTEYWLSFQIKTTSKYIGVCCPQKTQLTKTEKPRKNPEKHMCLKTNTFILQNKNTPSRMAHADWNAWWNYVVLMASSCILGLECALGSVIPETRQLESLSLPLPPWIIQ